MIAKIRKFFAPKAQPNARPDADGITYRPLRPLAERLEGWGATISDPRQRAIFDRVATSVDAQGFAALLEKYRPEIEASDELAVTKYVDLAPWFMVHSQIAKTLDIDTRPKCSILDIGAGGGQFLAIAKSYGHDVLAFDQPNPAVYGDLLRLLDVPRVEGGVHLGEPLPTQIGRFDMIVINGQVFDVYPDKPRSNRWEVEEWASFLEYLTTTHLSVPGALFLGLNRSKGPNGREDYNWPLVELAAAKGARFGRKRTQMLFDLSEPLRFDETPHKPWLTLGQ